MTHKKAVDKNAAWYVQETYEGKPHGWIQWKGTGVCMDINCKCGHHSHIDAEFAYHVKCPKCKTVYACNGHIELIELENEPDTCVVMDERDDGIHDLVIDTTVYLPGVIHDVTIKGTFEVDHKTGAITQGNHEENFTSAATGENLDMWSDLIGVHRAEGETDDELRERMSEKLQPVKPRNTAYDT